MRRYEYGASGMEMRFNIEMDEIKIRGLHVSFILKILQIYTKWTIFKKNTHYQSLFRKRQKNESSNKHVRNTKGYD